MSPWKLLLLPASLLVATATAAQDNEVYPEGSADALAQSRREQAATQVPAQGTAEAALSQLQGASLSQIVGAFAPGVWEGTVQSDYDFSRDRTHSDGTSDATFAQRNTMNLFTLRNSNFSLFDPGVLTGMAEITLGIGENHSTNLGSTTTGKSDVLGYAFDADVLNVMPYGGTLFANHSQAISVQPFGRVKTDDSNRGLSLRLNEASPLRDMGYPYLSANLRVEQQHIDELSTSALDPVGFRHKEIRNSLVHDGHKGSETSDLDWNYEIDQVQEPSVINGSYRSQRAAVGYSEDFGENLNRRWDSHVSYFDRVGSTSLSLLSVSERMRIVHLRNLSTSYDYEASRVATQTAAALTQSGLFNVQYQPYANLGSFATAQRKVEPAGRIDAIGGGLVYSYQSALPWQGKLRLRATEAHQLTNTHMTSYQLNINDEAQSAPAALGAGAGFLLNQPFVIASSIVVVDTRGGARLPTLLGVDYDVVPEGNQTRIVPVLTSAIIRPGDPLAISYTYEVAPSVKYTTTTRSASAGADFSWISFSASHNETDMNLLSGTESRFLQNSRADSAQVDVRGAWDESLQGAAGAGILSSRSTLLAFKQQRYYETATYRHTRYLGFGLNSDWTITNYEMPSRRNDTRQAHLTADWYTPGGWMVTALVGRRYLTDSIQPSETVTEASLRGQLRYGKASITSALTFNQRLRGGSEISNWQLSIMMIRNL